MALITLDQAHAHLRLTPGGSPLTVVDADLLLKMEQATAIVIVHIKRPEHGWTVDTDPAEDAEFACVQAAILDVLANLFGHRGDDDAAIDGPLSQRAIRTLSMLRDPAVA